MHVTMLQPRLPQILTALSLLLAVTWLGWSFRDSRNTRSVGGEGSKPSPPEYSSEERELVDNLREYGILDVAPGTSFEYTKIELEADSQSSYKPTPLQNVAISIPRANSLKSVDQFDQPVGKHARIKVPIPAPTPAPDASNIVFGVATDLLRLDDSLTQFTHWASGNGARIIAIIQEGPSKEDIKKVLQTATALNLHLDIIPSSLEFNDRYFALTKVLYENRGTASWAALIDDDTFFPSMATLQTLLSKYDPKKPHYIGSLSEDFYQIAVWGLIAYGGAGIFLSMPLLDQILARYDTCMVSDVTGDKRVAICILSHTLTRMTHEPSLHQVDLRVDASGFYEALRPQPVSVHHWKSWSSYNMPDVALVSKICGDACIFQKYRFADDWQLTNGFSLVKYGGVRDETDIRMETTWNNDGDRDREEMYRHSLAPLKPKDSSKIQYLLRGARYEEEKGRVRQWFVRRESEAKRIGIVEVVWTNERVIEGDDASLN